MAWWQDDLDGQRIGEYRIEEKLGQGGMAEVFRAVIVEGRRKGWPVAIKVPLIGKFGSDYLPLVLRRFEREVELQNSEPIPHIVKLLDAGEVTDRKGVGRPYLVMEYLAGESLAARLGGTPGNRERTQTLEEVLRWLVPIASALDALHASNPPRLHRDVKPENILFNTTGAPFLSDFGIATTLADHGTGAGLTGSRGGSPGSPGYQSPEAQRGEKLAASDQFSLAITVYEALSGKLPFEGQTDTALFVAMVKYQVVPLLERCQDLPGAAAIAVMKAMAERAGERYATCTEFANKFDEVARSRKRHRETQATNGHRVEQYANANSSTMRSGAGARTAGERKAETPARPPSYSPREKAKAERQHRSKAWRIGGAIVLLAGAGFAWFQFMTPAATPMGSLLVEADAPCELALDGGSKGTLTGSNLQRRFDVAPGEHHAKCVSTERTEISASATKLVQAAQQSVALLELRSHVAAAKVEELRTAAIVKDAKADAAKEAEVAPAAGLKSAGPSVGDVFRDHLSSGGEGPEMVVIPAGRFMMGSPEGQRDRKYDEAPQHEVSIERFAMGKYPVTKAQFAAFVAATGYRTDAEKNMPVLRDLSAGCHAWGGKKFDWKDGTSWRNPGFAQDDTHPVTCLSWNDAITYAEWLRVSTGKPYRLPSEAESEYSTRAGSIDRYPWGGDAEQACQYGNVGDARAKQQFPDWKTADCSDGYVFTSPVGHYQANAFGLYDTIGNVWKWTQDCGPDSYADAPTDGRANESSACNDRVLRGASWIDRDLLDLRSAARNRLQPAYRSAITGLRVGRDL